MPKDYTESIELNKSQSSEYDIPCERCSIETTHKVLLSVDVSGEYVSEGIMYWDEYQIIKCQGCKSISFRKNSTNTEDMDYIQGKDGSVVDEIPIDHPEIYPSRIAGRKKLKRDWLLPIELRKIYDETHSALSNKLVILAGIGIRTLIEAVCKEKKSAGANLKERIDSLVTAGVLIRAGADVLHTLRNVGNEAAHELAVQSDETLDIAIDVVENLLLSVYILPKVAEKLKEKPIFQDAKSS